MPSSNDFTARALRALGVIDPTETPSAEDAETGFNALNDWMESLATQRLSIYQVARTVKALTNGTATYTVGSGGDINIARPLWIQDAGLIIDNGAAQPIEMPISVLSDDDWAAVTIKTLPGPYVRGVWYDYAFAAGLATLSVTPVPDASSTSLVLYTPTALTSFADQTTSYSFPPGYNRAIRANLALELAGEYSATPSAALVRMAEDGLTLVKRANSRLTTLFPDPTLLRRRGVTVSASQFLSGQF